jgi:hypothetical protein
MLQAVLKMVVETEVWQTVFGNEIRILKELKNST